MYYYKSPSHMPNFDPMWMEDTNAGPKGNDTYGNKPAVILWNPDQPLFGPVWHVRANFKDLDPRVECTQDKHCKVCRETRKFNERRATDVGRGNVSPLQ